MFSKLIRWPVYLLFLLTPVFFLPWTTNILEVNKQMLLVILTMLALVAWLGSMVVGKRIAFRSGWLNLFPGLFLVSTLVSSFLSLAGYQTWVGQASQEYTSFLTTAVLVILFYVLFNNAGSAAIQRNIFFCLLVSASVAAFVTLVGALNLFHLPFAFASSLGFNTVGTLNALLAFLLAVTFMGVAAWLVSAKGKSTLLPEGGRGKLGKVLTVFLTVATVFLLVAVDFWLLWVIAIVGVLLTAMFGFLQAGAFAEPRRFSIPIFILLVSVLLLFLPSPLKLNLPIVVSPSYSSSMNIMTQSLFENIPHLVFGTGPGTFVYDYAKYKPAEVNQTLFWNTNFDRAKSYLLTILTTLGIAGTLTWLLTMLMIAVSSLGRLLSAGREQEEWKLGYVFFVGWVMIFLTHILYSSNMTLMFLLWGLSGLLAAQSARTMWETDFAKSPRLALASSAAFVVVAVAVLGTFFVTGSRYAAETAFAKAVVLDRTGADTGEVVAELGKAVAYNPLSDVYYRNLSSALLLSARKQVADANGTQLTPDQQKQISTLVSGAVNAAKRATDIASNDVSNWVVRGAIYRDVMSFVQNAEDFAAATFERAAALEPINPSHLVNLGRVHLVVADRARTLKKSENKELVAQATDAEVKELAAAEDAFNKAIILKPDFAPAHYYLAATYERQGKLVDAMTRLAALTKESPTNSGLGLQLALLEIQTKNMDAARAELERIVAINPKYSNALWYLSAVYEAQGSHDRAIVLLRQVLSLNPGNAAVTKRLQYLEGGGATVEIPAPVEEQQGAVTDTGTGEVVTDEPTE